MLPLVGSTITVSVRENPLRFRVLDHCHTDPVLNAAQRIEELALERDRRIDAIGDLVEFYQRCPADCFDNIVVNPAHGLC